MTADRFVDVRLVGHGHVHVDARPARGVWLLATRISLLGTLCTTPSRSRRTVRRRFTSSTRPLIAGHGHDVADAELVLDEDEQAVDGVADKGLRAQADGDADDADARQHGPDVDAQLGQDGEERDRRPATISAVRTKTVVEGLDALLHLLVGPLLHATAHGGVDGMGHDVAEDEDDDGDDDKDDGDADAVVDEPVGDAVAVDARREG